MRAIIRIYLENKKDVIRDIEITKKNSLEQLHFAIVDAFELERNEMASFYMINDEFEILKEIPLLNMKKNSMITMNKMTISSVLSSKGDQLLYVYDFLKMWRFLITSHAESNSKKEGTVCIENIGKMPKQAPKIIFEAQNQDDPFKEGFEENDELNDYEIY